MNASNLFYLSVSLMGIVVFSSCKPEVRSCPEDRFSPPEEGITVETEAREEVKLSPSNSMVLVHSVGQQYDYRQPWNKKPASYYSGFAVYLGDGRFLTTAGIVAHANFMELLSADGSRTITGKVKAADYEANLAVLEVEGANKDEFLEGLMPVELADAPSLGEQIEIWQFNDEGIPIISSGVIESTQNNVLLTPGVSFILYQIKSAVNSVTGGSTMPVMIGGKLAGISMSNETSEQSVLALTTPVVKNFLERSLGDKQYEGLPVFGVRLGELMDPVLRKYLNLPEKGDGAYILEVSPFSSADEAGIKEGDVLVSVNGRKIDGRGIIQDEKLGPVNCTLYIHDLTRNGEILEVGIQRGGKLETVKVPLNRDVLDKGIIPGRYETERPPYIVYGGLVFQPLTRTFLSEVFESNPNKMPLEILEVLDEQDDYRKEGRNEIIVLANILPTSATHGYAGFTGSILKKVNGEIPRDMKHLAELIDGAKQDVITFETNKPPFTIYFSKKDAQSANEYIGRMAIPDLRSL